MESVISLVRLVLVLVLCFTHFMFLSIIYSFQLDITKVCLCFLSKLHELEFIRRSRFSLGGIQKNIILYQGEKASII
jgi:hypothetical protein